MNHNSTNKTKPNEYLILVSFAISCFFLSRLIMYLQFGFSHNSWDFMDFLTNGLHHWDALWYESYSKTLLNGSFSSNVSSNGEAVWAFFPLFPLIESVFIRLFPNISIPMIAFISNGIFMIIGEIFAYKYILRTGRKKEVAYLYTFLLSFGIFSFYLSSMYSESLFIMLLIICLYCLKTKHYLCMGIAGAMLSATRNVGILFVFVILVSQICEYDALNKASEVVETRVSVNITSFFRYIFSKPLLILGTSLVPAGFFAYSYYLHNVLGDGLAFFRVQRSWGRGNSGLLATFIKETFNEFPPSLQSIEFICIVILIALTIINKRYEEAILPVLVILISTNSSFVSIGRLSFGSFSLLLTFADTIENFRRPMKILTIIIIMIVEATFLFAWFKSDFGLV